MIIRDLFLRYSQPLVLTGCAASFSWIYLNRKNRDKRLIYRNIRKENNVALFCDDFLRKFLFEVGKKMKIPEDQLKSIVLYYQSSISPYSSGHISNDSSSRSLPGIGLPFFYKCVYFDETNFEKLVIMGKELPITPDSVEGVEFRQSVLLTEDAKKFAIARQLYYLQSNYYEVENIIRILAFYALFQVTYFMRFSNANNSGLDVFRCVVLAFIGVVIYFIQREIFQSYLSKLCYKADKVAGEIGPRYFSGGVELYSKVIKFNKIMHDAGFTQQYNKLGNENTGVIFNYSWVTSHSRLHKMLNLNKE